MEEASVMCKRITERSLWMSQMRVERSIMDIQVGNIVKLKKKHPCGSFEWEVLRIGADFKLKCVGCEHLIMVPRTMVEKNLRGIR